jgi:hypothetical protein
MGHADGEAGLEMVELDRRPFQQPGARSSMP